MRSTAGLKKRGVKDVNNDKAVKTHASPSPSKTPLLFLKRTERSRQVMMTFTSSLMQVNLFQRNRSDARCYRGIFSLWAIWNKRTISYAPIMCQAFGQSQVCKSK